MAAPSIAALRRQMLQRGLRLKPVCPSCGEEREPDNFTREGVCMPCARRVLALRRIALIDARLATLWQAAREATSAAQAEAIEAEETTLEQERMELWYCDVATEEDRSHA